MSSRFRGNRICRLADLCALFNLQSRGWNLLTFSGIYFWAKSFQTRTYSLRCQFWNQCIAGFWRQYMDQRAEDLHTAASQVLFCSEASLMFKNARNLPTSSCRICASLLRSSARPTQCSDCEVHGGSEHIQQLQSQPWEGSQSLSLPEVKGQNWCDKV